MYRGELKRTLVVSDRITCRVGHALDSIEDGVCCLMLCMRTGGQTRVMPQAFAGAKSQTSTLSRISAHRTTTPTTRPATATKRPHTLILTGQQPRIWVKESREECWRRASCPTTDVSRSGRICPTRRERWELPSSHRHSEYVRTPPADENRAGFVGDMAILGGNGEILGKLGGNSC